MPAPVYCKFSFPLSYNHTDTTLILIHRCQYTISEEPAGIAVDSVWYRSDDLEGNETGGQLKRKKIDGLTHLCGETKLVQVIMEQLRKKERSFRQTDSVVQLPAFRILKMQIKHTVENARFGPFHKRKSSHARKRRNMQCRH